MQSSRREIYMIWHSLVAALLFISLQSCSSANISSDDLAGEEDRAVAQMMDFAAVKAAAEKMDFDTVKINAEQGDGSAQNILGFMYANGTSVTQNEAESKKWYLRAAEQGEPFAQSELGWGCKASGRVCMENE
jgi:TPR repeat protein